ncbi:Pyrimidine-specific ribonucleoside hydrolase RihA (Cytidine/uridine-specific hydrolase) [Durusdinium trenchii]|eukprot:g10740.t1
MAALVMLTTSPRSPRLRLVTTVHGVCAAPVAAPLAQRLLLGLGVSALVVRGATCPSSSEHAELPGWVEKHRAKLEKVSEVLELPELPEELSKELSKPSDCQTASTALLELDIKGVTLLALGPLTNVAAAAKANLSKFREVVGKIIVAGDNTKANPFNFRLDPVALDVVLNSGVPIQMVGTCCRPDAKELEGRLEKSLNHPMLLKILEQHPLSLVQDPVTAAYFLAPEIFTVAPVEVHGSSCPISVMEAKDLDVTAYAELLKTCFAR